MAYEKTIPNFNYGGHWFSKERYGTCYHKGRRLVLELGTNKLISDTSGLPDSTADPVDWNILQRTYRYWRMRFYKQGFYHTRYEAFINNW